MFLDAHFYSLEKMLLGHCKQINMPMAAPRGSRLLTVSNGFYPIRWRIFIVAMAQVDHREFLKNRLGI